MLVATAVYLCVHQRKIALLILPIIIIGLGYGLSNVSWSENSGPKDKTAALVQGAIPQEIKWHPDVRQPSIELYMSLTEPYWDRDLVVWPETAIAAFPDEVEETHNVLIQRAIENETVFVLGSPTRENSPASSLDKASYFNSLLLLDGSGAHYDKRHLVPFGEYMPFDSILRPITDLLNVPMSDFSKGEAQNSLLSARDIVIGSSICYEDAYGSLLRDSLPAANVLVNVSNDAWFGDTIAPHQHLQISQMRALELGRYMLRATNTGISAIIDQRGRIVAKSAQFEPQALIGNFKLLEGSTPFARFGSFFFVFSRRPV
jgi:apolipoprotein N-acyltransferase